MSQWHLMGINFVHFFPFQILLTFTCKHQVIPRHEIKILKKLLCSGRNANVYIFYMPRRQLICTALTKESGAINSDKIKKSPRKLATAKGWRNFSALLHPACWDGLWSAMAWPACEAACWPGKQVKFRICLTLPSSRTEPATNIFLASVQRGPSPHHEVRAFLSSCVSCFFSSHNHPGCKCHFVYSDLSS